MNIRLSLAAVVLAASASPTLAGGFLHVYLTPRTATLEPGGTMLIDIVADYSGVSSGSAIAGWKFDILSHANGTLAGDVNDAVFLHGVNNGTPIGPDLHNFAGGQLPLNLGGGRPSGFLGTIIYTDAMLATGYDVQLEIVDYFAPEGALNVYVSGSGAQSRPSPGVTGSGHWTFFHSTPFTVVPVPSAVVQILAGAGLLAIRRRR